MQKQKGSSNEESAVIKSSRFNLEWISTDWIKINEQKWSTVKEILWKYSWTEKCGIKTIPESTLLNLIKKNDFLKSFQQSWLTCLYKIFTPGRMYYILISSFSFFLLSIFYSLMLLMNVNYSSKLQECCNQ